VHLNSPVVDNDTAVEGHTQPLSRLDAIDRSPQLEIDRVGNSPDLSFVYAVLLAHASSLTASADDHTASSSQRSRPNQARQPPDLAVAALKGRVDRQAKQFSEQYARIESAILVFLR
jgi:hypothetical protein